MLPKLMAGFMILLAAGIFINGKSQAEILRHRLERLAACRSHPRHQRASRSRLYARLGFLITMSLLVFALLTSSSASLLLPAAVYAASASPCSPIGCSASP